MPIRLPLAVIAAAALAGLASLAASTPAGAGSFETLFGDQVAEPQAGDAPEPPATGLRTYDPEQFETAVPRRRRAAAAPEAAARPGPATPITVMTDGTLEPGDAVMTEKGIVVYAGDPHQDLRVRHERADFVPLARSREAIDGASWDRLAGLERRPRGSGATTGRSAATAPPTVRGTAIVDDRGRAVRYVGP